MSGTPESVEGYPFRFSCKRTGNCCARPGGVVRVTASDREAIADHLGLGDAELHARYLDASGERLRDGLDGACVFLEPGLPARCSIHAVRPERCRTWPFWPELRDDPAVLAEARRFCAGIEDL